MFLIFCLAILGLGYGQPVGGFIYKPKKPNQKGIIYCHGGFANIQIDMEFPDVLNYCNNGFTIHLTQTGTELKSKMQRLF
jgi:hypothetical protein